MWLRFTLILPIMMKNMISAKWTLFAAATACVVAAAAAPGAKPEPRTSETTVSVADFGAVPDDGKDDTRALRRAAEYCRTHPETTLLFPAGTYRLRDAAAERAGVCGRELLQGKGTGKDFGPFLRRETGADNASAPSPEGAQVPCK